MKQRLFFLGFLMGLWLSSQAQMLCQPDRAGCVEYKNTPNPATGIYTLDRSPASSIYKASQAYYYSGEGNISRVRVYGDYPGALYGVNLRIGIYHIGPNNRPTTAIAPPTTQTWW